MSLDIVYASHKYMTPKIRNRTAPPRVTVNAMSRGYPCKEEEQGTVFDGDFGGDVPSSDYRYGSTY